MEELKQWQAAGYARLSKEDNDNAESNSIKNQKALIMDYLQRMPQISLQEMFEDDGYSGVNFARPGFQSLIEAVKQGRINCIIVKDLSRFGRNYIEVGGYLEKIFPFLGVRFISINDHYDSLEEQSGVNEIMIPFKNLINEAYLRDTSIKIRSQFEIKRKRGDFVGAFAPYGYRKSEEDKNRLVVDDYAAAVICRIFSWKLAGYSQQAIAEKLNSAAEPSPYAYRKMQDDNYETPFAAEATTCWTPQTVARLLQNPVYIGTLTQGKTTTPNHKVNKPVRRPKEEWAVVENNHPPIISKDMFELVCSLMKADTRTSPQKSKLSLLSGLLFCADCHNSMCSKTVPHKSGKYHYYVCSSSKRAKACSPHSFNQGRLEQVVLKVLQNQLDLCLDNKDCLRPLSIKGSKALQRAKETLQLYIGMHDKVSQLRAALYEDFKDGILSREEFEHYGQVYSEKTAQAKTAIDMLTDQIEKLQEDSAIEAYTMLDPLKPLPRSLVVACIKQIDVFEGKRLEITLRLGDCFEQAG